MGKFARISGGRVREILDTAVDESCVQIPDDILPRIQQRPIDWCCNKQGRFYRHRSSSALADIRQRVKDDILSLVMLEALGRQFTHPEFLAFREQWRVYVRTLIMAVRKRKLSDLPTPPAPVLDTLLRLNLEE